VTLPQCRAFPRLCLMPGGQFASFGGSITCTGENGRLKPLLGSDSRRSISSRGLRGILSLNKRLERWHWVVDGPGPWRSSLTGFLAQ